VVAAASACLALAVLAAFAVAKRERLLEAWYVWRLEAGDPAEKDRAAEALAAMGSPQGARYLYEKVRGFEDQLITWRVEKYPFKDFVSSLGHMTGIRIRIDPSVDPSITTVCPSMAPNVPARDVLRDLLKQTGLGYRIQAGGIVLCPRGKTRDTFSTLPPVVDEGR